MKIAPKILALRRWMALMIWGLVAIGLVLRFTIRDRYQPWNLVYYMTPIPALPIWLLMAGILTPRAQLCSKKGGGGAPSWEAPVDCQSVSWGFLETRSAPATPNAPCTIAHGDLGSSKAICSSAASPIAVRSRFSLARMDVLLGLISLVWTINSECAYHLQSACPKETRLVFWNVARVQAGVSRLAKQLKSWNAPVIALVEADEDFKLDRAEWQAELSGYNVVATGFGGLIAVQGAVKVHPHRFHSDGSHWQQFDLCVGDADFTLLLVDISSSLQRSRGAPLDALAKFAEELNDRPVIIAGDFNTPDDSVWFAPLREHFREAFRVRGSGYAATWPMPLPVLTLDQIWINERVDVARCQHGWTIYSDHRPVISDISLRLQD